MKIPKSNEGEREQNLLIAGILEQLDESEKGECTIYMYGSEYGFARDLANLIPISQRSYDIVMSAFEKKGYSVRYYEGTIRKGVTIKR